MRLLQVILCALSLAIMATADEPNLLSRDGSLSELAAPDFKAPLPDTFRAAKGEWTPENGELVVHNIPEQKHIPVLHHLVGLSEAVIEVDFKLKGPGIFLVGCDSDKHVGRVVVRPAELSIAEDSVKPSHTIAKLPVTVEPGVWHHLRVEWKGKQMAASLDGKELSAEHEFLATPKSRSWLAASDSVRVRNLRISGKP